MQNNEPATKAATPTRHFNWHEWIRTGAALAVPLLVAWIGASIQQTVARASLSKDYVAIAVSVLSSPAPDTGTDKEDPLRLWAVQVLRKHSPVPFTHEVETTLYRGIQIWEAPADLKMTHPIYRGPELDPLRVENAPGKPSSENPPD